MSRRMFLSRQNEHKLSKKSQKILELMIQGLSADEMMMDDAAICASDITYAVSEAMRTKETAQAFQDFRQRMEREYPRAQVPWNCYEDSQILEMFDQGKTMREIAASVQRHQNAIRSRLRLLRRTERLTKSEQTASGKSTEARDALINSAWSESSLS